MLYIYTIYKMTWKFSKENIVAELEIDEECVLILLNYVKDSMLICYKEYRQYVGITIIYFKEIKCFHILHPFRYYWMFINYSMYLCLYFAWRLSTPILVKFHNNDHNMYIAASSYLSNIHWFKSDIVWI